MTTEPWASVEDVPLTGIFLRHRRRRRALGARLRPRRALDARRALRAEGGRTKASARANLASSFTLVNGVMIDKTYGVFPAWAFARSKRENLDRLRREGSLDVSADIMGYIAPTFFGDAKTAVIEVVEG